MDDDNRGLILTLHRKLDEIALRMERLGIAEYLSLLNEPRKLLLLNFAAGLARGLGFAVGATLLGALVLFLLTRAFILNLPVIGDFVTQLILIVQQNLRP